MSAQFILRVYIPNTANEFRASVCQGFLEDGRGFKPGEGGGGISTRAVAHGLSSHLRLLYHVHGAGSVPNIDVLLA